jgi:hypothetical protein
MDTEGWYRFRTKALLWMLFGYGNWFIQLLINIIQNWNDNSLYVKIWIAVYITYAFIKLCQIVIELIGKLLYQMEITEILCRLRIINISEYILFISGNVIIYTLNVEATILLNQMRIILLVLKILLALMILSRLIGKIMCSSRTLEIGTFFKILLDFEIPVICFIGLFDMIDNRISGRGIIVNMDYQEIGEANPETETKTKTNLVDIESLKSYPYHSNECNECSICLNKYEDKVIIIELPCCHIFHKGCISTWFQAKVTCPICRENVCHEDP